MELTAKILIADDNASERAVLREGLRRAGYVQIDEAQNGEEAQHKIKHGRYDAAIVNMMLTRLDGIGLVRSCRAEGFTNAPLPTFLMLSPIANQTMIADAISAGLALAR